MTSASTPAASDVESRVGRRIRELRRIYGFSQRELARLAGLTNGAVSMIEKNRVSPSVASLKKLLDAFGISLSEFFSEAWQPETTVVFRAKELKEVSATEGISQRQVGRSVRHRALQMLHERLEPQADTGTQNQTAKGEKAGIVVAGQLELTVGSVTKTLGAGDAFYFDARRPHRMRTVGETACELITARSPATP